MRNSCWKYQPEIRDCSTKILYFEITNEEGQKSAVANCVRHLFYAIKAQSRQITRDEYEAIKLVEM